MYIFDRYVDTFRNKYSSIHSEISIKIQKIHNHKYPYIYINIYQYVSIYVNIYEYIFIYIDFSRGCLNPDV